MVGVFIFDYYKKVYIILLKFSLYVVTQKGVKTKVNIYILRHGETDQNKIKVFYGSMEVALNAEGREQIIRAKEYLKNIKFDKVYSSERRRALETAKILLDKNSEVIIDPRLNEISFGNFEGKNYNEIRELYPVECEEWSNNWKEYSPPNGESYIEFYLRVRAFMEEIKNIEAENILLITHGGVIRSIYSYILEENLDLYWKFTSRNGDVSIIKSEYGNYFIDCIVPTKEH